MRQKVRVCVNADVSYPMEHIFVNVISRHFLRCPVSRSPKATLSHTDLVSILLLILSYKMSIALTILYVFFIIYETLMFRESGDARSNLVLFSYADTFFQNRMIRVEVINNVWLFIPFGIGMYHIYQKKSIFLAALLFSILIEATQYITCLGVAEFNDVFENAMGGMIGIVLASILIRQIKK